MNRFTALSNCLWLIKNSQHLDMSWGSVLEGKSSAILLEEEEEREEENRIEIM